MVRRKKAKNVLLVVDPEDMSTNDKRKYLEGIVAMGEDIRNVLKKEIRYIKIGIGVRHFNITKWNNRVKDWFEATADTLDWITGTRMEGSKLRHSYSLPYESFTSPRYSLINTQSEEEQLKQLDNSMKLGIRKLERVIDKLDPQLNNNPISIGRDYIGGDKVGRDKNTTKKINVDNTSKDQKIIGAIIATVIGGVILAWLLSILNL